MTAPETETVVASVGDLLVSSAEPQPPQRNYRDSVYATLAKAEEAVATLKKLKAIVDADAALGQMSVGDVYMATGIYINP